MAAARGPRDGAGLAAEVRDFAAVRGEFGLPVEYPAAALGEAERTVAQPLDVGDRRDATDLPLVTVDPAGSKDLDQAVLVRRRARGYRVFYAIADVAAFVPPSGALDAEVRRRGQSLYLPDGTVPLHPTVLSEGAASLLPEQVRPAVLWTIDLDRQGALVRFDLQRALVRSTAALDYGSVRRSWETGAPHPSIDLLAEVGRLRREQAVHRGAIELGLPEQQVDSDGAGGWRPAVRPRLAVEAYNAEISLLTGMCAAEVMLGAGVGILRTVPDPEQATVASLRRSARRLGVAWPEGATPAAALAGMDPARPEALVVHVAATRLLRGAGYTAFDGGPPAKPRHAGLGAAYAHVTAPLRRLADRYATEVCLAVTAGREVPGWALQGLPQLPSAMGSSDRLASQVERACLAQAQAWALRDRLGDEFPATVLRAGSGGEGEVFVADPPVIARCSAGEPGSEGEPGSGEQLDEGSRVRVRLVEADPVRREVGFAVVE